MCPRNSLMDTPKASRMPRPLFDGLISEMAEWQNPGILVLTLQNEPLMDNRLEDFIRHARACLPSKWCIELTTNANLLNEKRAEALLDAEETVAEMKVWLKKGVSFFL